MQDIYYREEDQLLEELIKKHTRLIYYILIKFKLNNDNEAISAGYDGLLKAIKTFDESKGFKFSTYASKVIYNEVLMMLRKTKKYRETITLNNNISEKKEYLDLVEDKSHNLARSDYYRTLEELKEVALQTLSVRHQNIVSTWLDNGCTIQQVEVAKQYNITQPQISRIISRFKRRLKDMLAKAGYPDGHNSIIYY